MQMRSSMRRHRGRALAAVALGGVALAGTAANASAAPAPSAPPAPSAAPAPVTLDWTSADVYMDRGARTWLGYATGPFPENANGTAKPSGGATGPTVSVDSPRGADQLDTFSFPAARGSLDPAAGSGTMSFGGTVTFLAPPPPAGHGFTVSFADPQIKLTGPERGQLIATGVDTPGAPGSTPVPYTATPVFNLDFSKATWQISADGTRTLQGIVPSIATPGTPFPARDYQLGAGPDRTPNTFGSFNVRIAPVAGQPGPRGPMGDPGPAGPQGPRGKHGKPVSVRVQQAKLARAPWHDGRAHAVTVTRNGRRAVIAAGSVTGRNLTLMMAKHAGPKHITGLVVLHQTRGHGKQAAAAVRIIR